jgi:hypothetical protein
MERSQARTVCVIAMMGLLPVMGIAQGIPLMGVNQDYPVALDLSEKLAYAVASSFGPWELLGSAAYAGILQGIGTPAEWGGGAAGYGKRLASTLACSGIHGALAFGLDSALHEDPRYFRSRDSGFWTRTRHAVRGTILTRTDAGGETFSVWRFGSAYGAAFLSNEWYPARLDTIRLGFLQGSLRLGFDLASNLGSEFWPDIKTKILRQKP